MIDSLLYAKPPSHLKRSINLAYLQSRINDQIAAHLEENLNWVGWKKMENYLIPWLQQQQQLTNEVNHKTTNSNKKFADFAKNQNMSVKIVRNAFVKSRSVRVKNKLAKDKIQKHTHFAHTAKELTTEKKCAGMPRTRLTDLKCTKLKVITIQ